MKGNMSTYVQGQNTQTKQADLDYCDACGGPGGTIHVTVTVKLVTKKTERTKVAHFWLCEKCEDNNRSLFENRSGREGRLARAMTPLPEWKKEKA